MNHAEKFPFEELEINPLHNEHDLSEFNCNHIDLNEFLQEKAYKQMAAKINVSYVILYQSKIIAYFTIAADSIRTKNIWPEDDEALKGKGITYKSLPALKLGRLAVDLRYQNMGLGSYLLENIIRKAQDLSESIGLRYITVDAYIPSLNFYIERYFILFPKEDKKIRRYHEKPNENYTVSIYIDLYEP
jgi:GNAT superfamily N-acetyltransferase